MVWNEPGNYYTIEIVGRSIQPVQGELLFSVDGKFFQIVTTRIKVFLKKDDGKSPEDQVILARHQKWESDYLYETLHTKLKIDSSVVKLPNGKTALAWGYDVPKLTESTTVVKQLYLTVVKGDRILLLNTVVEKGDDENIRKQFLIDTMTTLRPSDKPLSLKKAGEMVLKGKIGS